jgi:hypothetical protein
VYAGLLSYLTIRQANWIGAFFFVLYATGFGWVALATIWEAGGRFTRSRKAKTKFAS